MTVTNDIEKLLYVEGDLQVEVVESRRFSLRVDPTYARLSAGMRSERIPVAPTVSLSTTSATPSVSRTSWSARSY